MATKIGDKWRAQVRIKGRKPISKYCNTKAEANEWAHRTKQLIREGKPPVEVDGLTVADLIRKYRRLRDLARPIADTSNEHYQLNGLTKTLGSYSAAALSLDDLVGWATRRRDEGAGPYTINMDLSKLGTVYRYAGQELGLADPTRAARAKLDYLGLIGDGGRRERRPTEEELLLVMERLAERHGKLYADAVLFAAVSAMRRGEVTSILWKDVDEKRRLVGCWRKHPRRGKTWEMVPLLPEAWKILQRQPREDERCFPIHEQTLSKYFKAACDHQGIPDLHLHDLRHEGTSRLFEAGYTIEQVALVTGHRQWKNLQRYTNLKPEMLSLGKRRGR